MTISITKPTENVIFASIIEKFLAKSKCTTDKEKEYLLKLLGNKKFVTYLLYQGSEHGWDFKDFHSRCDNKGPTISLFKVKDGDCIGGFTKA
jgi:TLD